ncbi:hypothetical protein F444_17014, partial [Phytophthora nicotianae P1976]
MGMTTDLPHAIKLVSLFLIVHSDVFASATENNRHWTYPLGSSLQTVPVFTLSLTEANVVVEAAGVAAIEILPFFRENNNASVDPAIRDTGVRLQVQRTGQNVLAAVGTGHGRIAWCLRTHRKQDVNGADLAVETAVLNGDIPLVEWLLSNGSKWPARQHSPQTSYLVAASGQLDVLEWLFEKRPGVSVTNTTGLLTVAAEQGHLNVVQWLIDCDTKSQQRTDIAVIQAGLAIDIGAVNGHLEVAKYLRARAASPSDSLQRAQVGFKQVRQLQEISRECGGVLDAAAIRGRTIALAASNGHLDVVTWLVAEYGADSDTNLFDYEESLTSSEIFAMDGAAMNGHLDVVRYLHELRISRKPRPKKRKRNEVAQLTQSKLWENRPEGCTTAAEDAAAHGRLDVVRYLDSCGTNYTDAAMDTATSSGHLQ